MNAFLPLDFEPWARAEGEASEVAARVAPADFKNVLRSIVCMGLPSFG